ncbi:Uncharacterised protein [Vibrio cholerae]|nr:Uncharacterised protein [Vibrio cholerae]CSA31518.1 Uncharacterised protein [Vibrio cholerae]CSA37305.1 Uncharacterised protein [Vibrio cholerae]CSA86282.1 Uncharacterised protein [Vibrio cholerae]CSB22713.1 Uncharacterised protein [Vibrio cholerae]
MTVDVSRHFFDIIAFFSVHGNGLVIAVDVFQRESDVVRARLYFPVFVFAFCRDIAGTTHHAVITAHVFQGQHDRLTVVSTDLERLG